MGSSGISGRDGAGFKPAPYKNRENRNFCAQHSWRVRTIFGADCLGPNLDASQITGSDAADGLAVDLGVPFVEDSDFSEFVVATVEEFLARELGDLAK